MRQITAVGDTGDNHRSSSSNLELWKTELRSELRRRGGSMWKFEEMGKGIKWFSWVVKVASYGHLESLSCRCPFPGLPQLPLRTSLSKPAQALFNVWETPPTAQGKHFNNRGRMEIRILQGHMKGTDF